jgi:RNA polymerase primary sigma factor
MARNGRRPSSPPLASRELGGFTAIDLYLDELGRYPLLDAGQEDDVARRARAGDGAAFETLIRSNLRFVVSVAKRYQNRGLSFPDLVQEGNVGLVTAARKFDPDQGVKFISYAVWWIRQAILAALARHSRSVRLPLNRATELGRVLRTREELRQTLRREPTPREIAEAAALEVATVEMLQALNVGEVRLDAPVGDSDDNQLQERFLLDETDLEVQLDEVMLGEHLDRALRLLRPRDARVVRLYYGLQGEREHTLEEIGHVLGITRERVRQLRDRALRELRQGELGKVLATYAA